MYSCFLLSFFKKLMDNETCLMIVLLVVIFYKLYARYGEGFDDARAAKIYATYHNRPLPPFDEYRRVIGGSTVEYYDMRKLQHDKQLTPDNIKRAMD